MGCGWGRAMFFWDAYTLLKTSHSSQQLTCPSAPIVRVQYRVNARLLNSSAPGFAAFSSDESASDDGDWVYPLCEREIERVPSCIQERDQEAYNSSCTPLLVVSQIVNLAVWLVDARAWHCWWSKNTSSIIPYNTSISIIPYNTVPKFKILQYFPTLVVLYSLNHV